MFLPPVFLLRMTEGRLGKGGGEREGGKAAKGEGHKNVEGEKTIRPFDWFGADDDRDPPRALVSPRTHVGEEIAGEERDEAFPPPPSSADGREERENG